MLHHQFNEIINFMKSYPVREMDITFSHRVFFSSTL
jgi:hypothetical protein